jgi:hypothetical protein
MGLFNTMGALSTLVTGATHHAASERSSKGGPYRPVELAVLGKGQRQAYQTTQKKHSEEQSPEKTPMQLSKEAQNRKPPNQFVPGIFDVQSPVPIPSFGTTEMMSPEKLLRLLQAALWGAL